MSSYTFMTADITFTCLLITFADYGRPMEYGRPLYLHPVSFFLSSFFFLYPRLISAVRDWMSIPYFRTWCGLSENLECTSETCCTRLAENTGRKKVAKNRHLGTIAQLSGYIFATKAHIDNRKKNLLSSNMSSTCPHSPQYGELRPTSG